MATFEAKLSSERAQNKSPDFLPGMLALPLKGLAYGDEFLYVARAVAKQKSAVRREAMKKLQNEKGKAAAAFQHDVDDDGDDYGAPDFGGGDDGSFDFGMGDDHGGDDAGEGFIPAEQDGLFEHNDSGKHFATTRIHVKSFDFCLTYTKKIGCPAQNMEGRTFEELCRAHIQAVAKGEREIEKGWR